MDRHRPYVEEIAIEIAYDGLADWQMDADVCANIYNYRDHIFSDSVRDHTIEVLRYMVENGLIKVGKLGNNEDGIFTFRAWPGTTEEVIGRLAREWPESIDYPEGMGDFFWISNTSLGNELGKTHPEFVE